MRTLTKNTDLRRYFEQVLLLSQVGEQFPVDFDLMWPLVYKSKQKAVNELLHTKNSDGSERYIKNVDYQTLNQKVHSKHNAFVKHTYILSVPCMEWLIARKVRPVFEVYRKVFHNMATEATNKLSKVDRMPDKNGNQWLNYHQVLKACGYSTTSGYVRKRMRKYSLEFFIAADKYDNVVDVISTDFAKVLCLQADLRVKRAEMEKRTLSLRPATKSRQKQLTLWEE